ncbi:hypothetical protein C8Q73DRAFT_299537 [Cubamyces lactineus]|nr:hypothetical protein C8Q73DRAFT_299537 [Cubamyces lactineus]
MAGAYGVKACGARTCWHGIWERQTVQTGSPRREARTSVARSGDAPASRLGDPCLGRSLGSSLWRVAHWRTGAHAFIRRACGERPSGSVEGPLGTRTVRHACACGGRAYPVLSSSLGLLPRRRTSDTGPSTWTVDLSSRPSLLLSSAGICDRLRARDVVVLTALPPSPQVRPGRTCSS